MMLYCSESAKYSQVWFLFLLFELVEIFRLGVNFIAIVVMAEKQKHVKLPVNVLLMKCI